MALFTLAPIVFAGVAGPVQTPAWKNCIGQYVYVASTGKAYTGTSNILVVWVARSDDSAGVFPLCIDKGFTQMQFTVQIYHAGYISATGPTFTSSSPYPPSGITVQVVHQVVICTSPYSCQTRTYPYILQTGDGVCVNEDVWYGLYDQHSGGYCYKV